MRLRSFDLFSVRGDRPVLRFALLVMVFALTALAFWWHFERRMAVIAPPREARFLWDQDKIIPAEEARRLHGWRKNFKEGLGLEVLVMVSRGAIVVPEFAPGTLFVGLGLGQDAASPTDGTLETSSPSAHKPTSVIALPPLARKALGEGVRLHAEETLALCAGTPGQSPLSCLQQTLNTLWQALSDKDPL